MQTRHGTPGSAPSTETAAPAPARRSWRRAGCRRLAAVAAATALLVTACSSSGSADPGSSGPATSAGSGAGTSGSSSASNQKRSGPAYAQCMRQHGVTDFPDPQGPDQNQFLISGAVQNNPHFAAASKACEALRPQQSGGGGGGGGISQQQLLAFAQCMRANGLPDFPDPLPNGGINFGGVDPNSPSVQHAMQVCDSKTGLHLGGGQ